MLSIPHLVIIFIVALAVLGPEKLPKVARTMGRAMAELRRVTGDFRYQIDNEMREMDRQASLKQQEAAIAAARASGAVPAGPVAPFETAEDTALGVSAVVSQSTPTEAAASSPEATPEAAPEKPKPPAELAPADQKLGNAHS